MQRPRMIPEIVEGPAAVVPPKKLSPTASMQVKVVANKLAVIEQVVRLGNQATCQVYADAAAGVEQLTVGLERYDAAPSRLGDDVRDAHQTAKINGALRLYQTADTAARVMSQLMEDLLERLMLLPDAVFYTPSFLERLSAVLRGTHADLELRPGAPRLTPGQAFKELVWGGVVDEIAAAYDQQQVEDRQQARSLALADSQVRERLAALAAMTETAPPADQQTASEFLTGIVAERERVGVER